MLFQRLLPHMPLMPDLQVVKLLEVHGARASLNAPEKQIPGRGI
jgi:hypothetical protein